MRTDFNIKRAISKRASTSRFATLLLAVTVSALLLSPTLSSPPNANAQIPFGGIVYGSVFCPCSINFMLFISPPVPANVMYQPGPSFQYPFFQLPRTGVWTLGLYSPGGACLFFIPFGCTPVAYPAGTIMFAGTSM